MARKRMFDLSIIDSDLFLDMPQSTRLLYYDLNMRADDDGFVGNPKKIARLTGASDDDLRILFTKKFVIPFQTGICVIRHWKINNYLRKDRYTPTIYQEEKQQLIEQKSGIYEIGIPSVDQMATQYSKEENSIEKNSKEEIIKEESPEELLNCDDDDDDDDEFINFLQNDCNYIIHGNETEINTINLWRSIDRKIIKYSIKEAQRRNITNINYIHKTILNKLEEQEAQIDEENFKKGKQPKEVPVPDWVGKEIKKKEISKENLEKMEEMLKEFK